MRPDHSAPPSTLPSPLPQPSFYCAPPPFSFKKREGLPGISVELGLTSYNYNRHIYSCQGWTWQARRRKRIPRAGKRVRIPPSLLGVPHECHTQPYCMCRGSGQTHAGSMIVALVSVSPYEHCLVDFSFLSLEDLSFFQAYEPLCPSHLLWMLVLLCTHLVTSSPLGPGQLTSASMLCYCLSWLLCVPFWTLRSFSTLSHVS